MKDRLDAILRPAQAEYLDRLLPPRDRLLAEMEAFAAEHQVPISDPEVGRLLTILARAAGGGRILEVGTAIGYGTLCLARGAPKAQVVTIDRDPAALRRAREYLRREGVEERVELAEGEALEILGRWVGNDARRFALIYIDGDKASYRRLLDLGLQLLTVGGVVVVDNLLWKGQVADPGPQDDPEADEISSFNGYLMMHPQLDSVVLPLGDGIGLAVKKRPLVTDLGGPF